MVKELLDGYIDMHVHNGPSNVPRLFNTGEFAVEADKVGCRAFITKDHYYPSMSVAAQANSLLEGKVKTTAYGSLILNNSIGGICMKAVDAACAMGVKYVSLPTISAANHIKYYEGRAFPGSKGMLIEEKPIITVKPDGKVTDEVEELIQYLAHMEEPPVLATGHGSREEQDAAITRACELGVPVLVNHPYYGFDVHKEDIVRWAEMGAYIELTAINFVPGLVVPDDFVGTKPFMEYLFERISIDRFVVDSDMGQRILPSPVEGVYKFVKILMDEYGFAKNQIDTMVKHTPAKLMHL